MHEEQSTYYDFYGKPHSVKSKDVIDRTSVYGIFMKDDSILLVQNPLSSRWEPPGGGVEPNESLEDALVREYIEEAGVTPLQPFTLLREWTEYFFDVDSQRAWRAQRKFYAIANLGNGNLLHSGNGEDSATARMIPLDTLNSLTIPTNIREVIALYITSNSIETSIKSL